ncbi:hypothetical protein CHGG_08575 [Chaetomium globosum CBS 148.51]|uniref:SWIM-type domain-containing protein n=1 Tax=Chaetomium globosum (strain ATCC 6205 / CBS 148.51 / DSM 1962 / NBRC 6347 / NRRL 1970) TaxID=306901 RepID=Q2GTX9_CHAGB|nr:uncharacterized protein CHGG_08575 [Chaetomium globosum CBS 148.51]EAQ84561.1 hypothetical protein CHGG_08575 [Chaetomium globosum CBS 148.51]
MSTAAQSSYAASTADNANNVAAVFLPRPRSRLRTIAKQYDEAAQQTVTHTDEPYKIVWGSRTFVISGVLNKKKSRGRRSWITREGWFLTELTTTGKVKQDVWCCRRCDAYGKPQSHNIAEDSPSRPDNEMTVLDIQREASNRSTPSSIPQAKISRARELLVGYIVDGDLPFTALESVYIKELLKQLDPGFAQELPHSRSTIGRDIKEVFESKMMAVKADLTKALSQIHISFDLWTSPNNLAMISVFGHFINQKKMPQSRLLAFRRQLGKHSGNYIALTIQDILKAWGIGKQVGVCVADNAGNNDTCLKALYRSLDPTITDRDIKARRMRCFGHVLNLVVQAFLFGQDATCFERAKGPVGKLHNIVKFIRASPQRSEAFRQHAKEAQTSDDYLLSEEPTWDLGLKQDNSTRWNSTYLMIERAVRKRDDINSFILELDLESDGDKRIPDADKLTTDDWKALIEIKTILEPLYKLTIKTQGWGQSGTSGRLSDVLMGMEYLRSTRRLRFNEGALPSHARDEYVTMPDSDGLLRLQARERASIRASINNAWKKLDEYYTKLADSPLFTAAIILNPNLGLRWLRRRWRDPEQHEWLVAAKDGLKEYFDRWYCSSDDPPPQGRSVCRDLGREDDAYEAFVNSRVSSDEDGNEDEIDRYYNMKVGGNVDPVEWWISNKAQFPKLSQMALDILAIPAMAADCERSFSIARLTLSSQRHAMKWETIEMLQMLKNWLRNGDIVIGGVMKGSRPDWGSIKGQQVAIGMPRPSVSMLSHVTTSAVESSHSSIKKYLVTSRGDLKSVFERLVPTPCHGVIYSYIRGQISTYALHLLATEVAKLPAKDAPGGEGDICTCSLPAIHGLPCRHTLYKHLTGDGPVELKQIHKHWWSYRPVTDGEEQQIVNVVPNIPVEPVKVKGKGRPAGTIASVPASKKKGEGITGTKRLPSAFEYELETEPATAVPPSTAPPIMKGASAGKPRGRPRKQSRSYKFSGKLRKLTALW